MQCTYCPQASHMANYKVKSKNFQLSLEDFKKFIGTIPPSVQMVFAGMAEPFLNKEGVSMVEHAFDKGHMISVYTTAEGLTKEDIDRLKRINYNHFCLHVPDAGGLMNLKVGERYLDVLKYLWDSGIVKNTMCIGTIHPDVARITGPIADGSKGLYSRGGNLKELMIPRKTGRLHCTSCTDELNHNVLMPNGEVLLCCMDYNQKHVIGNLHSMTYGELFQSDEYKRVRQGMLDESVDILCRRCEISGNI